MRDTLAIDGRLAEHAAKLADADEVPKVQLAYPKKGVWSGSNNLGYEIAFDLSTTTAQSILMLPEWGFPECWTVSLAVRFDQELVAGQFFDCTAEIDFGSGGIMQSFEIDWVDGAVFSLPMNAVNIRARWNDLATLLGLGGPAGVKVSALLSRGSPARSRATLSRFFILGHQGESSSTSSALPHDKIPAFAKSAQILPINSADVANLYDANFEVSFFANRDATTPVATVTGDFIDVNTKIPIPPFARYYGVKINGTASVAGWVIFNLFDE
jgi:hypothetical protein